MSQTQNLFRQGFEDHVYSGAAIAVGKKIAFSIKKLSEMYPMILMLPLLMQILFLTWPVLLKFLAQHSVLFI